MSLNKKFYSNRNKHGTKVRVRCSKCCLVFLDLNHHVMYINELASDWQTFEGVLRENLLEPMVVLD